MSKQELQQTLNKRALIQQLMDEARFSGDLPGYEAAKAKVTEINEQLQERHYGPINRENARTLTREKLEGKDREQLELW